MYFALVERFLDNYCSFLSKTSTFNQFPNKFQENFRKTEEIFKKLRPKIAKTEQIFPKLSKNFPKTDKYEIFRHLIGLNGVKKSLESHLVLALLVQS